MACSPPETNPAVSAPVMAAAMATLGGAAATMERRVEEDEEEDSGRDGLLLAVTTRNKFLLLGDSFCCISEEADRCKGAKAIVVPGTVTAISIRRHTLVKNTLLIDEEEEEERMTMMMIADCGLWIGIDFEKYLNLFFVPL